MTETEIQPKAASSAEQLRNLRARYSGLASAVAEGKMTLEAALAEAEKRSEKPRSGYARKKIAMTRLYAERDRLQAEHDALQSDHSALLAELRRKSEEVEQLQSMYAAVTSDVQLVLAENQKLLEANAVLRSAVQPQPTPQPAQPQQPYRQPTPPGLPSLFSRGYR